MDSETIELDLTECEYIKELHERIRIAFDFPDWYGANADALWDLLTEPFSANITVIGTKTMPQELQNYFTDIIKIFEQVKIEQTKYGLSFDYNIIN